MTKLLSCFKVKGVACKGVWTLKGFALGVACLVPGVSAGTVALILGVYEKIISALLPYRCLSSSGKISKSEDFLDKTSVPREQKFSQLIFLLCLGVGVLMGVFLLAGPVGWLLSRFPLEVYSLFIGLILGSIPGLFCLTDKKTSSLGGIVFVVLSIWGGIYFFPEVLKWDLLAGWWDSHNPSEGLLLFWVLFGSGFLAAFASVLPGLSGSMVLVIMGTYPAVLNSLSGMGVWQLVGVVGVVTSGAGIFVVDSFFKRYGVAYFVLSMACVLGMSGFLLLVGSELLFLLSGGIVGFFISCLCVKVILEKKRNLFFCIVLGLILGSLPLVFPYEVWDGEVTGFPALRVIVFMLLGAGFFAFMVYGLPRLKAGWGHTHRTFL